MGQAHILSLTYTTIFCLKRAIMLPSHIMTDEIPTFESLAHQMLKKYCYGFARVSGPLIHTFRAERDGTVSHAAVQAGTGRPDTGFNTRLGPNDVDTLIIALDNARNKRLSR